MADSLHLIAQQREKEIEAELSPQAFKLASVDNIDVHSQYSKAYAGKVSNIWHGTSIQCIEPKSESPYFYRGISLFISSRLC